MRPRRLRIAAFGPFAGEVDLDFDALAPAGLFLVHGPTGAGKTSILDAVVYALFGTVAGARPTDGVRSHHAAPGVATTVELELSLHGRDWRITRSPKQERPKKRGEGTTTQQPIATLARRDDTGAWEPVATRVEEVSRTLRELLPLDAEQFQQVVLLPQGDFERALRADAHERETLLSTLFATRRFTRYADELLERARSAREALDRHDDGCRVLEQQAVERWRRAVPGGEERERPEVGDLAELAGEVAAGAVAAEARRATAEVVSKAAGAGLADARALAARHDRRDALLARRRDLHADADRVEALAKKVDDAERAAPLVELLAGTREAEGRLHEQRVLRARTQAAVTAGAQRLPPAFAPIAERIGSWPAEGELDVHLVGPVLDDLAAARERVDGLRKQASDAEQACRDASARGRAAEAARRRIREAGTQVAELEAEQQRIEALVVHQRECGARLPGLADAAERLAAVATAAERAATLAGEREAARRAVEQALTRSIAAKRQLEELLQRRLANMAAELSAQLLPEDPCPVCGSREHPQPASAAGAVTPEERAAAEQEATAAEAALRAAEERERASVVAHEKVLAVAGDAATDPSAARVRADCAAAEQRTAEQAAAEVPVLEEELGGVRSSLQALHEERSRLEREAALAEGETAQLAARAAGIEEELARAVGEGVDLPSLAEVLGGLHSGAGEVQRLALDETRTIETLRQRDADLRRLLPARGFASVAEAEGAAMPTGEQQAAASEVEQHRVALATVAGELDADDLRDLPPRPDLDAAQQAEETARAELSSATKAAALAHDAADELARLRDRHREAAAARAPLAERTARLEHLAAVCRGTGNDLRMSLERYVLAAHLEEITDAASTRLREMTDGRYTLRHSDARTKGGGASGLSILVHDAWTGREREAASLSGGETFQASLALALGVADVVRRHQGGIELDTLFVDEGFGSLDPEALDQAMAVLDQLRAGGRMVGVISHVPAVKERIATGITVERTPRGSRAFVSAEAAS